MGKDFFILMLPELSLMLILFLLLGLKIGEVRRENSTIPALVNILLLLHIAAGFLFSAEGELFSGMYRTTNGIMLEKSILACGTLLVSLLARDWLKKHEHVTEFYILLLASLLGMNLMLSSGNFLVLYLGLELSTIPLAALANFDLEKKQSSEAALKMILSSAFASCILLFGISLLYGTTGSIRFDEIAAQMGNNPLQLLAFVFVLAGFAFKLSVVPFHFWTADVYEGAPVAVTAFLSVISKGSVVFAFVSVLPALFLSAGETWHYFLIAAIGLTILVGNLFALKQENIKRFLAFSSVTQAGYLLLGISEGGLTGSVSAVYFMLVYIFSNLAAFGVISMISVQTGKENISDLNGFRQNNPVLAWVLALALFSLAGIPPTAGFFGKIFLVSAGAASGNYVLVTFAALNMIISLYYYLRVVKAVLVNTNEQPLETIRGSASTKIALYTCTAGVVAAGVFSWIYDYILIALQ